MIVPRKNKAGKTRYQARVYKDGKKVTVGTFDLEREAKQAIRDTLSTTKPQGPSCGEFARLWLAQDCPRRSGRQLKSETVREYHYRLKGFIRDFEKVALTEVARSNAFHWALEHKHDVPFVAALFAHAHDLGLIESNPFAGLGLSKGSGRRDNVPLSEVELYELADCALEVGGTEWSRYAPQFRAFILFQGFTGLRPGEAFELRWKDIEGDRIRVARRLGKYGTVDTPKSGVGREVLLPPPAREALSTFPRSLDLVFRAARGGQLRRSPCFRYFDRVRREYGRPDLDLYDLRHFCAHQLYVRMGLPARVVATQLGHSDGGALVERLYGHGDHGAIEELEEAWSNVG